MMAGNPFTKSIGVGIKMKASKVVYENQKFLEVSCPSFISVSIAHEEPRPSNKDRNVLIEEFSYCLHICLDGSNITGFNECMWEGLANKEEVLDKTNRDIDNIIKTLQEFKANIQTSYNHCFPDKDDEEENA